jgi:hypothetical protein
MTRELTTLVGLMGMLLSGCSSASTPNAPSNARAEEPIEEVAPLPGLHNDAGIFALDPAYSVLPDGSVTEIRNRDLGPLRTRNEYFNAERRTIRLFGAQNQEVAVQLVMPVQGLRFSARAEGLEFVPADRITFSVIGWSRVAQTFLPDVIVPLDGSVAGLRTFDIPLKVAGLPDARNRQGLLLMEVWIPKAAAPGVHRGTVSVLADGKEIAKLGVDLTVFPLQLPDRPAFRMDYLSYGSPLRVWGLDADLGDGGSADLKTTPEAIAAEQHAFALALDNRGYLNVLPYASQRGTPFYGYPVQGVGRKATIVSFDGFDRRFGPLLDGRVGKYGTPPPLFTLPFNLNYPHTRRSDPARQFGWEPFKTTIPERPGVEPRLSELEDTWRAIGQQTLAHVADKGWTRTAFEIYNNQKPATNNRSPWSLDEPVEGSDFRALRYLFNLARWSFEGAAARGITIVTRVDIGHWECEGLRTPEGTVTGCYKAKDFDRADARGLLQPVVDRWVVGHVHVHGAQDLVSRYNTERVMFDEYSGSGVGAAHGGEFSGLAWIAHRLGVEGRMVYHAGYLDPANVTGDGTLYNGRGLGFTGVLASRRVKLWRDAVNDYDLIALARKADAAATTALLEKVTRPGLSSDLSYRANSRTIETFVTNNVEDLPRARRLAAAIAAGEKPPTTLEGFSPRYAPAGSADTIAD